MEEVTDATIANLADTNDTWRKSMASYHNKNDQHLVQLSLHHYQKSRLTHWRQQQEEEHVYSVPQKHLFFTPWKKLLHKG